MSNTVSSASNNSSWLLKYKEAMSGANSIDAGEKASTLNPNMGQESMGIDGASVFSGENLGVGGQQTSVTPASQPVVNPVEEPSFRKAIEANENIGQTKENMGQYNHLNAPVTASIVEGYDNGLAKEIDLIG